MIYYLPHYPTKTFSFLEQYFSKKGKVFSYVFPGATGFEYLNALIGAWRAVRRCCKDDTIITYMCSAGVLCWWVGRLLGKHPRIIAANLTLKDDTGWRTKLMTFLYKKAVKDPHFALAVTSRTYGDRMQKLLHTETPLPLLRDYAHFPGFAHPYRDKGKRIFCGGNSLRDWQRCLHIATLMSDWHFLFVGRKNVQGEQLPANVKSIERLPFNAFVQAMQEATLVLNIAKYNCPAGLIVMMQASWLGKVVVMNRNDVTVEYITDKRGIIAESDEDIAKAIASAYMEGEESMSKRVSAMQDFLQRECSAQAYCQGIDRILARCE